VIFKKEQNLSAFSYDFFKIHIFLKVYNKKCLFFGLKKKYYAQKTIRKTPKKLHLYICGLGHYGACVFLFQQATKIKGVIFFLPSMFLKYHTFIYF
jgi:hypothetical protein